MEYKSQAFPMLHSTTDQIVEVHVQTFAGDTLVENLIYKAAWFSISAQAPPCRRWARFVWLHPSDRPWSLGWSRVNQSNILSPRANQNPVSGGRFKNQEGIYLKPAVFVHERKEDLSCRADGIKNVRAEQSRAAVSKIPMRGMWPHFGKHGWDRGPVFMGTESNSGNITYIRTFLGFVLF